MSLLSDLILAAGSQFDKAAATITPNYPDVIFCVVNGTGCDGDNIAPIFPREYEAIYMQTVGGGSYFPNELFFAAGKFALQVPIPFLS